MCRDKKSSCPLQYFAGTEATASAVPPGLAQYLRPLSALQQVPARGNGVLSPVSPTGAWARSVCPPGTIPPAHTLPRSHRPRLAWKGEVLCTLPVPRFMSVSIAPASPLVKSFFSFFHVPPLPPPAGCAIIDAIVSRAGGLFPCHPFTFARRSRRTPGNCCPFTAPMWSTPPSPSSTPCPPRPSSPNGCGTPWPPTPTWWRRRRGPCWAMPTPPPFTPGQPISGPRRPPSTCGRTSGAGGWAAGYMGPWRPCSPPRTSSTATPASPCPRWRTRPSPWPASASTSAWVIPRQGSFISAAISSAGGTTWSGWKNLSGNTKCRRLR